MRDEYDAKTKYNIKRSELCLSMLIPSGEQQRCGGALCEEAGWWWWTRVEGECLL